MRNLRWYQNLSYAALGAPIKALTLLITLYVPAYYASGKLGLVTVGLVFMCLRFFDILVDPIFGAISDHTRVRFGRRRIWIAAGLPVLALSIWMLLSSPQLVALPRFIIWLCLFYCSWTVVSVSHTAWATELAEQHAALRQLIGWREWAGMLGMLAIMVAPTIQEHYGIPMSARMNTAGLAVAGSVLLFGFLTLVIVPERPSTKAAPGLRRQIHHIRKSRSLRWILGTDLLAGLGYGAASALMMFVIRSWFDVGNYSSSIMLIYFAGMIVSVPFWIRVAARSTASVTYRIALGGAAIAQLVVLALPSNAVMVVALAWIAQGFFAGAYQFSLNTVMAEVIAHDQHQQDDVLSGVYYALLMTTNKIGYAAAIGIAYPLLKLSGYSVTKVGAAAWPATLTYALLPAFCLGASALCMKQVESGWNKVPRGIAPTNEALSANGN